jgi:uncharacterized RDD family membrane protein YckC
MLKRWRGDRWFHAHETSRFDSLNGLPLASFKQRAWAYLFDLAIVAIVSGILGGKFVKQGLVDEGCKVSVTTVMIGLAEKFKELAESIVYFAVLLKLMNGQTPGKKLFKLRVVSLTHHGMGWWQSIERALGYGASLLEGGFGFFQFYLNPNRMCVHDRIAETIVIDLRKPRIEPPLKTDAVELASERQDMLESGA